MLTLLDEDMNDSSTRSAFEKNLLLQQQNITETGEQSSTRTLTEDYNKLKSINPDSILYSVLERLIEYNQTNMEVIQKKSTCKNNGGQSNLLDYHQRWIKFDNSTISTVFYAQ